MRKPVAIVKAHLVHEDGLRFRTTADGAPGILFDADDAATRSGPSPVQGALLSALACTAADIVLILQKQRVDFTSLEIEADAERAKEDPKGLHKDPRALPGPRARDQGHGRQEGHRPLERKVLHRGNHAAPRGSGVYQLVRNSPYGVMCSQSADSARPSLSTQLEMDRGRRWKESRLTSSSGWISAEPRSSTASRAWVWSARSSRTT